MTFEPADPKSGQDLDDYVTAAYLKSVNDAIRYLMRGGNISGGPNVTTTQFGKTTTIKARSDRSAGLGVPNLTTHPLSLGTGDASGFWVDADGNKLDLKPVTICIDGVETDGWIMMIIPEGAP